MKGQPPRKHSSVCTATTWGTRCHGRKAARLPNSPHPTSPPGRGASAHRKLVVGRAGVWALQAAPYATDWLREGAVDARACRRDRPRPAAPRWPFSLLIVPPAA